MKKTLEQLYQHQTLSTSEASEVLIEIAEGKYNEFQIAAFLTAFNMRDISLEELTGFRNALMELCVRIDLDNDEVMDLCGTGGDGRNTFNISTLASFVTAGAGIPVAKHGNYGVSSVSGSSNVLEYLGVSFQSDENRLRKQLDNAGICFLHAPLFHPALKLVAPVRKQLGTKTFFNSLGPLVNPARPKVQLTGVFSLELARLYHYLFQDDRLKYTIVRALDGYDEVSLTGSCKLFSNGEENTVLPEYFNAREISEEAIHGGKNVHDAALIFMNVLHGKGTPQQNDVVVANAALAIQTYENTDIETAVERAKDSLFSGKALRSFQLLHQLS